MTSEHRLLVEPSDILSVEFVCKACGGGFGLKPGSDRHFVKTDCPNCGDRWTPSDSVLNRATSGLFRALGTLIQMQAEAKFQVRLHIELEDPTPTAPVKPGP